MLDLPAAGWCSGVNALNAAKMAGFVVTKQYADRNRPGYEAFELAHSDGRGLVIYVDQNGGFRRALGRKLQAWGTRQGLSVKTLADLGRLLISRIPASGATAEDGHPAAESIHVTAEGSRGLIVEIFAWPGAVSLRTWRRDDGHSSSFVVEPMLPGCCLYCGVTGSLDGLRADAGGRAAFRLTSCTVDGIPTTPLAFDLD